MAKKFTVTVVDSEGYAIKGKEVKRYGDDPEYTDKDGQVELMINQYDTIYVTGREIIYDYSKSKVIVERSR